MKEINAMLIDRGKTYGDYRESNKLRADIMELIRVRYYKHNDKQMDPVLLTCISDIVGKLSRIACTPTHIDSWIDIIGYSKRIIEMIDIPDHEPVQSYREGESNAHR